MLDDLLKLVHSVISAICKKLEGWILHEADASLITLKFSAGWDAWLRSHIYFSLSLSLPRSLSSGIIFSRSAAATWWIGDFFKSLFFARTFRKVRRNHPDNQINPNHGHAAPWTISRWLLGFGVTLIEFQRSKISANLCSTTAERWSRDETGDRMARRGKQRRVTTMRWLFFLKCGFTLRTLWKSWKQSFSTSKQWQGTCCHKEGV